MKPLYIQAMHSFIGLPQSDQALKAQLKAIGIDARRMSRFTQLALLGALPLKNQITLETAIYLAGNFSSPSKFNKMFTQLMAQDLPSPIDFMANLNNAATFHIAQSLQTQGCSLFVAVNSTNFFQPLQLAALDLALTPKSSTLVGWAFEHSQPDQLEGSCWFLVSNDPAQAVEQWAWDTELAYSTESFFAPLQNKIKIR